MKTRALGVLLLSGCIGGEIDIPHEDGQDEAVLDSALDTSGVYAAVVIVNASCSGTLVDESHVLTAAHCVCQEHGSAVMGATAQKDAGECSTYAEVTVIGRRPAGGRAAPQIVTNG